MPIPAGLFPPIEPRRLNDRFNFHHTDFRSGWRCCRIHPYFTTPGCTSSPCCVIPALDFPVSSRARGDRVPIFDSLERKFWPAHTLNR